MDTEKQFLLIEYMISNSDIFALVQNILEAKYFDPELRPIIKFIKQYFEKYHSTPTPEQIKAETGYKLTTKQLTPDQIQYCAEEIEKFCRRKALEIAVLSSPQWIENNEYQKLEDEIRKAITISLKNDLGLRYFENIEQRLNSLLNENQTQSTGWKELDDALFGGISRKELVLVSANSGGGKSITLANLGYNFVYQGLNVLYISLELSEHVVAQRFDSMFTGIGRREWKNKVDEIAVRLKQIKENQNIGVIDIVHMPSGTTPADIRAYLKNYYLHYKMMPDLLIVDYLDLMYPNQKVDYSDIWTKDKLCSEQLRDIGVEYNMFVATASQLNRSAVGETYHNHSMIAGGISKVNTADVYWSIIMSDEMRAAGEIAFQLQKTRNSDGVGRIIYLKWDPRTLRITDRDDVSKQLNDLKLKNQGKKKYLNDIDRLQDLVEDDDDEDLTIFLE